MNADSAEIDSIYESFYQRTSGPRVYPTEFVVRTFLSSYPGLDFPRPKRGDSVLDVGFGDGRNTVFLCEQGFEVSGIEITQAIVDMADARLRALGYSATLRVGRNSRIGFGDESFDCILACHSCYYCDEGETLHDNLREYARVLKPGGHLIASVADHASYIFEGAQPLGDGTSRIVSDPYGNRVGYRLQGFSSADSLIDFFSERFTDFSLGHGSNNYYGIDEKVHWIVCRKKPGIDI